VLVGLAFGAPSSAQENNEYTLRHTVIGDPWITQVTVWSSQPFENDPVSISVLDQSPTTSPQLLVGVYLDVSAQGLATHAAIDFKVPRTWLEQNYVGENDVVLLRLVGETWENLPTQENESDNTYVYYVAQSSGFSVFAIAGRQSGQPPTLLGVLIVVAGVSVVSLVYWFLIRPRRMFTSLKKLKHEVGPGTYAPPPAADREMSTKVKKLREATGQRPTPAKVERLKTSGAKKASAEEDVLLLKRLKKRVSEEAKSGKQT
jgi:PGF-pre-PGF domain-containing protein